MKILNIEDKNKDQLEQMEDQEERQLGMIKNQGIKQLEVIKKQEEQLKKKSKIKKAAHRKN